MFSPWSIQEQIIDYKICSFITRFYYQYTYSWKPESLLSAGLVVLVGLVAKVGVPIVFSSYLIFRIISF